MNSHHAPHYSQLSSIVGEAVEVIERLLDPSDTHDNRPGIEDWLRQTRQFVLGSRRMVEGREVLQRLYDPYKPDPRRDNEIDELLRIYRHLWYFVQEEPDHSRFIVRLQYGELVPPIERMNCDRTTRYIDETHQRLLDHNIITEIPNLVGENGEMSFYLNEPDEWC